MAANRYSSSNENVLKADGGDGCITQTILKTKTWADLYDIEIMFQSFPLVLLRWNDYILQSLNGF